MNIYYCPKCGTKFLECELINFKCSENYVGAENQDWCPNCIKKYDYVKLVCEKSKDYKKINDAFIKIRESNF